MQRYVTVSQRHQRMSRLSRQDLIEDTDVGALTLALQQAKFCGLGISVDRLDEKQYVFSPSKRLFKCPDESHRILSFQETVEIEEEEIDEYVRTKSKTLPIPFSRRF